MTNVDAIICVVQHDQFKYITLEQLESMKNEGKKVLIDIKDLYERKYVDKKG